MGSHDQIQAGASEAKGVLLVFPGSELGGAERQGLHLARYLKSGGHDVHVWSTLRGQGRVVQECRLAGIPFDSHRFLWPCRKSSLVRDTWRLIWALRRLRPDAILSYCTSPNVGCGLAWRLSGAKACIWGQRNTDDLRGDGIERFAYRRVSAVICNAAHETEYLGRTLGSTSAAVHVVRNGLDLASAMKSREEWRAELSVPEDAPVAVMLANFRPQKDHATLLRAWTKVLLGQPPDSPPLTLILAGAPQFTHDDVKRLAGDLGILESVRFPGQVKDVAGLLRACDIGVLISHHEGLSNSVLEYMASGLPVIATDLPANREALGDGVSCYCRPSDPTDLAERLAQVLLDPDLRAREGAANKRRAEESFSIETMCRSTMQIINGLLEERKR